MLSVQTVLTSHFPDTCSRVHQTTAAGLPAPSFSSPTTRASIRLFMRLQAACGAPDDGGLIGRLPPALLRALMPFQRVGVEFALRRGGRALIADEMGLVHCIYALELGAHA